jgi:Uma2 family endonuclease
MPTGNFAQQIRTFDSERTAQGEIIIVAPVGMESEYRGAELVGALRAWAEKDGRGKVVAQMPNSFCRAVLPVPPMSLRCLMPNLRKQTQDQRRKFPALCPEFIVEVMSPSDRLKDAKEKMAEWMAHGAQLGWLIEANRQTV